MGPSTSQRAGGRCAASPYNDLCKNHVNEAARLVSRYGRFLTATRHAMSLLKPLRRMVATGGEIFARTAKTPHPTVGLLRGARCPYKNRRSTVRAGTRYARHRPYQDRDSQSRQLVDMGLLQRKTYAKTHKPICTVRASTRSARHLPYPELKGKGATSIEILRGIIQQNLQSKFLIIINFLNTQKFWLSKNPGTW